MGRILVSADGAPVGNVVGVLLRAVGAVFPLVLEPEPMLSPLRPSECGTSPLGDVLTSADELGRDGAREDGGRCEGCDAIKLL